MLNIQLIKKSYCLRCICKYLLNEETLKFDFFEVDKVNVVYKDEDKE